MKKRGFTLLELIVTLVIIGAIVAVVVPTVQRARRADNERSACGWLKQFGSVEVTYKTSDLDQTGINSYWTADAAGLYYFAPSGSEGPIRWIEFSAAFADGDTAEAYSQDHESAPKKGYWVFALKRYENEKGSLEIYGNRHPDRFGFIVVPHSFGVSGRLVYMLNESGSMVKRSAYSESDYFERTPEVGVQDTCGQLRSAPPAYDTCPRSPNDPSGKSAGPWSKFQ